MAELALSVLGDSRIHLIDSKPLPVANPKSPPLGKRSSWSQFPEARKGFSTMGMVFGFKLHALTNLEGLFERWAFAAANHPDVTRSSSEAALVRSWLARELTAGLEDPESPSLELVLGDKAYIGTGVLTPKRSNMTRRVRTPRSSEPVLGGPQPWGDEVWTESLARVRTRSSKEAVLVRP